MIFPLGIVTLLVVQAPVTDAKYIIQVYNPETVINWLEGRNPEDYFTPGTIAKGLPYVSMYDLRSLLRACVTAFKYGDAPKVAVCHEILRRAGEHAN